MVKSIFFPFKRLIAAGVIYVPSGLLWLRMHWCSTHLSEQFIKKRKKRDTSVKAHLLKRHKAILLWKVNWKTVLFIILLMRVTNVLTAWRPLVIGGKFLVSGERSPCEKLPATWRDIDERVLQDRGAGLLPLLWRLWLERPPPLCVMESLPSRHYRVVSIAVSWFICSSTSQKSWNLSN